MRELLRWDKPLHRTQDRIADVSGIGRYHIKRTTPRVRQWDVRLNGKLFRTAESAEEAVGIAERDAYARLNG